MNCASSMEDPKWLSSPPLLFVTSSDGEAVTTTHPLAGAVRTDVVRTGFVRTNVARKQPVNRRRNASFVATTTELGDNSALASNVVGKQIQTCKEDRRRRNAEHYLTLASIGCRESGIGPNVEEQAFYSFIQAREKLRIRKEIKQLPRAEWSHDPTLQTARLTNVRREHDRTTRAMRRLTDALKPEWLECAYVRRRWRHEAVSATPAYTRTVVSEGMHQRTRLLGSSAFVPTEGRCWDIGGNFPMSISHVWTPQQKELARLLVFNCALWRAFGTAEFAQAVGFQRSWDKAAKEWVVEVAMSLWEQGIWCFTDAYNPSRKCHNAEIGAHAVACKEAALRVYRGTCERLEAVWNAAQEVAAVAESTLSWRRTTKQLMQTKGYGGTGFLAKEVVQDLLHTPIFLAWESATGGWKSLCQDINQWSAVGPGARRGLNRIHGRPKDLGMYDGRRHVEEAFLKELQELHQFREFLWPETIEGEPSGELQLHDVQFQLCEYDKYLRAKFHEGKVRRYVSFEERKGLQARSLGWRLRLSASVQRWAPRRGAYRNRHIAGTQRCKPPMLLADGEYEAMIAALSSATPKLPTRPGRIKACTPRLPKRPMRFLPPVPKLPTRPARLTPPSQLHPYMASDSQGAREQSTRSFNLAPDLVLNQPVKRHAWGLWADLHPEVLSSLGGTTKMHTPEHARTQTMENARNQTVNVPVGDAEDERRMLGEEAFNATVFMCGVKRKATCLDLEEKRFPYRLPRTGEPPPRHSKD